MLQYLIKLKLLVLMFHFLSQVFYFLFFVGVGFFLEGGLYVGVGGYGCYPALQTQLK